MKRKQLDRAASKIDDSTILAVITAEGGNITNYYIVQERAEPSGTIRFISRNGTVMQCLEDDEVFLRAFLTFLIRNKVPVFPSEEAGFKYAADLKMTNDSTIPGTVPKKDTAPTER